MIQFAYIRTIMKEKSKIIKYPNGNKKTETYKDEETLVTKHFYNTKDAYVKELSHLKNGVEKVKYFTEKGVTSKLAYFVDGKRHGVETRYFISKNNASVKSTKSYENGKLHGEKITYNEDGEVVKSEIFSDGKLVSD